MKIVKVEKIRDMAEKYRSLVENAHDVILTSDLKGNITTINRAIEDYGLKRDDIVGKSMMEFVAKKYWPKLRADFSEVARGGSIRAEIELVTPIGNRITEYRSKPMMKGKEVVGIHAVVRDITERKKMEEALIDSEEKYRTLMEEAPIGVCSTDLKGRVTYVNKKFEEVTGYAREEVVGKNGFKLGMFSDETLKLLAKRVKDRLMGKPARTLEMQFKCKDGRWIWIDMEAQVIEKFGVPVGFQIISKDITERKKAGEALKRSTEILDALHRHAIELSRAETIGDIAKMTFNVIEKILGFNLGSFALVEDGALHFIRVLGLKEDKIPDMPLTGPGVTVRTARTGRTQLVSDTRKDKDYVWFAKSPRSLSELVVPVKVGEEVIALINLESMQPNAFTAEDAEILETLAKYAAYHISHVEHVESESRFQNVIENASDVIYTLSEEGSITSLNPVFERITGWSRDDWVGKPFTGIVHPEDLPIAVEAFRMALQGKTAPLHELQILTKSGGYLIGEFSSMPLVEKGKPVGEFGIARDITERKRMEKALGHERDLLQALMDNIPDAIYFKDEKSRFTRINKGHASWLQVKDCDEAIGKTDFDFYAAEFAREAYKDEQEILETKEPLVNKIEKIKRPDGSSLWVSATKVPIKDKDGQVVGIVGISRDITERKKIEEELTYERDLLQALMDNIPDRIYFKDTESRFTSVNRATARRLGVNDPKDVTGKTDFDFYSKDFAEETYQDEQKIIKSGQPLVGKVERVDVDGVSQWVSITKVPIKDQEGRVTSLVGISRDITKLVETEQNLAHERDLLQALMDNIPDLIYYKDVNSKFTRINKAEATVLGVKDSKDAEGKTDFDFFTPEHSQDAYKDEQEIVKTGKPLVNKAEKIRRADGQFRWVSATKVPIKDQEGRVTALVGISRDITKLVETEEALRESEEKYRKLFEGAIDAIFVADAETGVITDCNPAASKMIGRGKSELVGQHQRILHPPQDIEGEFSRTFRQHLKEAEGHLLETQVIAKNGEIRDVDIMANVFEFKGRKLIQGIFRDITERKQMEEDLRRYSTHLEELVEERTEKLREAQRLAAIGETAAMVGHDLRNPLQTITAIPYMVGQMVQSMPVPAKKVIEKNGLPKLMDMLRDQAVYMNKIVSDLQDYARPVSPELQEANLYVMIIETLSAIHVPENIEVRTETEPDFLATLDSYLMKRVLTNLILNAIQAMPEGGNLTIKAARTNKDVSLSVQDTGTGIPEETLPKLFQPLFTTKAKGQGFGLAVCKRIVEAHGGSISVTSKVGCGSIFTVRLPLRQEVKRPK